MVKTIFDEIRIRRSSEIVAKGYMVQFGDLDSLSQAEIEKVLETIRGITFREIGLEGEEIGRQYKLKERVRRGTFDEDVVHGVIVREICRQFAYHSLQRALRKRDTVYNTGSNL